MSIKIITDSSSEVREGEFDNVVVLPMLITIDGKEYYDGRDISKDEFYRLLETSDTMPVTSMIAPNRFEEVYEQIRKDGDEAIVLPISASLSSTFQSASLAADGYEEISVVDTLQATSALYILVKRCRELIAQGLSRAEIVEILDVEKHQIVTFGAIDTLKYLQKGGRISKSTAIVGGLIGIKPILALEEGKIVMVAKARGSKQSSAFLNKRIMEFGGIDFARPYAVGYTGSDPDNLIQYMKDNQNLVDSVPGEIKMVQTGSAVGTHLGPGAVLVTFFSKGEQ